MRKGMLQAALVVSFAQGACIAVAQPLNKPLRVHPQSTLGYHSVAEALQALRSQQGVVFTIENGWLIATDEAAYTIWSFAPQGDPAFPAVVKRQVIPKGSHASVIQMKVHCEATKEACDALVRTFAKMNGLPLKE